MAVDSDCESGHLRGRPPGTFADYLAIARLDHSAKHIFIVPGIVFAVLLRGVRTEYVSWHIVVGLVSAICVASANYVVNEWFDRDFDQYHPTKSQRAGVRHALRGRIVCLEWLGLLIVGLGCAWFGGMAMFAVAGLFAIQGIFYNVPPIRTKDRPYVDVISESVNNPLRLMIGWAMIDPTTLPPSSILLAYWLGGAFLMAAKRMSEYREIAASHGRDLLVRYRASFAGYSETSLNVSCFMYGLLSSFFLAVFLIKYRIEYLVLMPVITILFGYYLALSMQPGSSAQKPEKLFRERGLMLLVALLAALFAVATIVDLPSLEPLTAQRYISLP